MGKVIVLGATGTIGSVIVKDLVESGIDVIAADLEESKLKELKKWTGDKIEITTLNIKDGASTQAILRQGKVCVNAINYIFNIDVMKAAAAVGINVLDLGGLFNLTKEQLKLDQEMKDANVLSIPGIGSDPGVSNVFSRYGVDYLDEAEEIHVRYGSTTSDATFTFAIDTIIDEYINNALIVKDGKLQEIPALSDQELTVFHEDIGSQKTYSIIHSELATFPNSFPNVKNITYKDSWDPSTIEKIKTLISLGLLDETAYEIRGESVIPRRQTVSMMQTVLAAKEKPTWGKDTLQVEVKGIKNGNKTSVKLEVVTGFQPEWNASPTQYATAVPASIVAQMILKGEVTEKGVKPPEQCIDPKKFVSYLKEKNVQVNITVSETQAWKNESAVEV